MPKKKYEISCVVDVCYAKALEKQPVIVILALHFSLEGCKTVAVALL